MTQWTEKFEHGEHVLGLASAWKLVHGKACHRPGQSSPGQPLPCFGWWCYSDFYLDCSLVFASSPFSYNTRKWHTTLVTQIREGGTAPLKGNVQGGQGLYLCAEHKLKPNCGSILYFFLIDTSVKHIVKGGAVVNTPSLVIEFWMAGVPF